MIEICCPTCGSPNLEYVESVRLVECLSCGIAIWDEKFVLRFEANIIANIIQPEEEGDRVD